MAANGNAAAAAEETNKYGVKFGWLRAGRQCLVHSGVMNINVPSKESDRPVQVTIKKGFDTVGKKRKGEWELSVVGEYVAGTAWCKFRYANGRTDFWGVNVSDDSGAPDWRGEGVGKQPSRRNLLGQAKVHAGDQGDRPPKKLERWSDNPLAVADLGRGGTEALLKAASGGSVTVAGVAAKVAAAATASKSCDSSPATAGPSSSNRPAKRRAATAQRPQPRSSKARHASAAVAEVVQVGAKVAEAAAVTVPPDVKPRAATLGTTTTTTTTTELQEMRLRAERAEAELLAERARQQAAEQQRAAEKKRQAEKRWAAERQRGEMVGAAWSQMQASPGGFVLAGLPIARGRGYNGIYTCCPEPDPDGGWPCLSMCAWSCDGLPERRGTLFRSLKYDWCCWILGHVYYDRTKDTCVAYVDSKDGKIPIGAQLWHCRINKQWVDRTLTMTSLASEAEANAAKVAFVEEIEAALKLDATAAHAEAAASGGFMLEGHPWATANGVYQHVGTHGAWPYFVNQAGLALRHYMAGSSRAGPSFGVGCDVDPDGWSIEVDDGATSSDGGSTCDIAVAFIELSGAIPTGEREWEECFVPPYWCKEDWCEDDERCTLTLTAVAHSQAQPQLQQQQQQPQQP